MEVRCDSSPISVGIHSALPLADPIDSTLPPSKEESDHHVGPREWRSVLFPAGKPSKIFKLRFIPPSLRADSNVGVCSKEYVKGDLEILDLTLVGFFLGKRPAFSFVRAALLRQWKLRGNVEILQLLHGGFAFRFSDVSDRDDILDGEAFYIGGQPMFIRKWERSLHSGGILGLKTVPLWITLPGLPLHLWGEDALSAICSVLGTPLYADRTTAMKSRLAFARVCVEFNGEKPMLETVSIEDDMGLIYNQKVCYEWKPPQCFKCGVFGHAGCGIDEGAHEIPARTSGQQMGTPNDIHKADSAIGKAVEKIDGAMAVAEKENHAAGTGNMEDEGWEPVRARKKRPVGSGAPFPNQTRPDKQRYKGGEVVSRSHWAKRNLPIEKVPHSNPSLNKECFSNSKSWNEKDECPLSQSGVLIEGEVTPGQKALIPNKETFLKTKSCLGADRCPPSLSTLSNDIEPLSGQEKGPLTSEKPNSVSTFHWRTPGSMMDHIHKDGFVTNGPENSICDLYSDKDTSPILPISMDSSLHGPKDLGAPIRKENDSAENIWISDLKSKGGNGSGPDKGPFCFRTRPGSSGSTAGHTPFKSRLASLARDLKMRKIGPPCEIGKSASSLYSDDQNYLSNPLLDKSDPIRSPRVKTFQPSSHGSTHLAGISGVDEAIIRDGMVLTESDDLQLHMEMPKYLLTRKKLMEKHPMEHIVAKEKPMMDDEDQGSDSLSDTTHHEREGSFDNDQVGGLEKLKHVATTHKTVKGNFEGKEDSGLVGLGVGTNI